MNTIKFEQVENKILSIKSLKVIIDSDVALLYGLEIKRINQALSDNAEISGRIYSRIE